MATIELESVTKRWGPTTGVDNVSFNVESGTFAILLGPSGCGKSTTLRMIAGLEEVTEGRLRIGGNDITDSPPSERALSMVFQSYALFPHLNVAENIVFGLRVRKVPASERVKRLERVAEIVGLQAVLERKPGQLSGGQRQRVALARAIIADNDICLMDEPLSNLDAKVRHYMRIEIRALQQRLDMTVIYVTHDQAEAMSMGDKVILMREGIIEQEGTPEELYQRPMTTFAASFIGTPPMRLLDLISGSSGMVAKGENSTNILEMTEHSIKVGIRPEHITISDSIGLPAELVSADYLGSETMIDARIGDQPVLVRWPGQMKLSKPTNARLSWSGRDVHVFDAASGKRIENLKAYDL